ncbi:hypothetical protein BJ165DRAFT_443513 [Panaeolus papilionaceus]|nr:hypothetical protein BJ165DRAFT_443513 [Panaeolus papilionaceus]
MGFLKECQNCRPNIFKYDDVKAMLHYRDSPYHHFCHVCDKHLSSRYELKLHAEKYHADTHCTPCYKIFYHKDDMNRHRARSSDHPYYCEDCEIEFKDDNSYRQHRLSSTHQPANTPCGLKDCNMKFTGLAALALHWEGGACSSGIDAVDVYRLALRNDYCDDIILAVDREDITEPINEDMARRYTTGHGAFRCPDTEGCSETFATAYSSMQHFNSRHATRVFKCPNEGCHSNARFSSVGAMSQHLYSGTCDAMEDEAARMVVSRAIKGIRCSINHPRSGHGRCASNIVYAGLAIVCP